MRLALVTSCRNPGELLRDTIASVLGQRVDPSEERVLIDYCVIDAASEDGAIEHLRSAEVPPWIRLTVRSEPDGGLHEGLWKGFGLVRGDWFGWLNAGDLLAPGCHRALSAIDAWAPDVSWVTGLQVNHDREGDIYRASLPLRFRNDFLQRGLYGRSALPFVQQESTFWRADLHARIPATFAQHRRAGDLWLWSHFARQLADQPYPLAVASIHLGGWRLHDDHLAAPDGDPGLYLDEARSCVGAVRPLDRIRASAEARRWRRSEQARKRARQRTLFLHGDRISVRAGRSGPQVAMRAMRRIVGRLRRGLPRRPRDPA